MGQGRTRQDRQSRRSAYRADRLDENLGALSVDLTADDRAEIERVSSGFEVQGTRYPEEILRRSGL